MDLKQFDDHFKSIRELNEMKYHAQKIINKHNTKLCKFAEYLHAKLIEFVKENKDLYSNFFPGMYSVKNVRINANGNGNNFILSAGYWEGQDFVNDDLCVPFLMLKDPAKYRELKLSEIHKKRNQKKIDKIVSIEENIKKLKEEVRNIEQSIGS